MGGSSTARPGPHPERGSAQPTERGPEHVGERRARRALALEAVREYANGALWVLPGGAALVALAAGFAISQIDVQPGSVLARLAFQGTADDARDLLTAVSSTVVTVIALVLGLTVVALQLSSTQFSPRLLRNFLRDRATQVVLSVFIATFVYSAAGLFTVGLEAGVRTESYPRLAVSGSIVLLFLSLGMVVFYADHLVHSIQIDAINRRVERGTLRALRRLPAQATNHPPSPAPAWALPLRARRTGYVQTVHPELLLPMAAGHGVTVCLRPKVGQHIVAGAVIGWVWRAGADEPAPAAEPFERAVQLGVRVGFERTLEQDIAFGIRQQIDIATKALSPAINDPYTAIQALDHLSVVYADLAGRPLGARVLSSEDGRGTVIVPANTFEDYVQFVCGLIGRYGTRDSAVVLALIRLLRTCADTLPPGTARVTVLQRAAEGVRQDAEAGTTRPADLAEVRSALGALERKLAHPPNTAEEGDRRPAQPGSDVSGD